VAPVFDHIGKLAAAVNITSCRRDLDRTAHRLALAATMLTVRRIDQSVFRSRFRDCWIATLTDGRAGGCAMIAFDEDQRVLGASRAARQDFNISDTMIGAGVTLSRFLMTDDKLVRPNSAPQLIRRHDGESLRYGRIAAPLHARSGVARSHPADFADGRSAGLTGRRCRFEVHRSTAARSTFQAKTSSRSAPKKISPLQTNAGVPNTPLA
jgi:sigma-54 dependent transcriptional regulator, acetoin dehydrogenase operon transcriptional activator AcoR